MSEKKKITFEKQFVEKTKFAAALNVLKTEKYVHGLGALNLNLIKR